MTDGIGLQTECGAARRLADRDLRCALGERTVADADVSECGRCFRGTGGC